MQNPMKGSLKRRFKAVLPILAEKGYTIMWATKSTGTVYTKGGINRHGTFHFESHAQLVKWLEKQGEE